MVLNTIKIDENIELRFRTAITKKGGKKGSLNQSVEEAILLWLKKNE